MNRRDLLRRIAIITGSSVVGYELFLTGSKTVSKPKARFTDSNIALLDEVGETIIPATTTPGAKAIKIGEFMKLMVTDCYLETEQAAFMQGIIDLELSCKKMHGKSFMHCNVREREDFLLTLEKEAKSLNSVRRVFNKTVNVIESIVQKDDPSEFHGLPVHYYTMMKQLTLLGFFTSETGMTETLRHISVPGKYDGELPYVEGERAWAEY
ncbi:hypothetical protein WSM22_40960 [Cytophagales bacterium WSM2-2]|nr:hypothetical protein WSM22_40960 [Cytophagales bacterium WSM2-2]